MAFSGFPTRALRFHQGLEVDNSKAYWTEHRSIYDACIKEPMKELLAELEPEFGPANYRGLTGTYTLQQGPGVIQDQGDAIVHSGNAGGFYVELNARGLFCTGRLLRVR